MGATERVVPICGSLQEQTTYLEAREHLQYAYWQLRQSQRHLAARTGSRGDRFAIRPPRANRIFAAPGGLKDEAVKVGWKTCDGSSRSIFFFLCVVLSSWVFDQIFNLAILCGCFDFANAGEPSIKAHADRKVSEATRRVALVCSLACD